MKLNFLNNLIKKKQPAISRFSLHSGERQTAPSITEIRRDHVARYEYASQVITNHISQAHAGFGIDLFCGNGYGTSFLANTTGQVTLGIDASTEAIDFANKHYACEINFFTAKAFPFSLPKNTFDFVVCLESLEHVEDAKRFLTEIFTSMKPGALLILSTPNSEIWSLDVNPNPFHYRHYSREELLRLLSTTFRNELRLLDWHGQNIYHFVDQKISHCLPTVDMELCPQQEGQILVFTFIKQP